MYGNIANTKQKHAHQWQIAESGCLEKNYLKQKNTPQTLYGQTLTKVRFRAHIFVN